MPARLRTGIAIALGLLLLALMLVVGLVARPFDPGQRLHDRFAVWWARFCLAAAGLRVEVDGALDAIDRETRYMIVANHQSLVDPLLVVNAIGTRLSIRFTAKKANFKLPVIGLAMRLYDHLPLDPKSLRGSIEGLRRARESVRYARSMVFFPEGTRTLTGEMGEFKNAAFRIAQQSGAPLLPLAISGAFEVMPKGSFALPRGATVRLTVLAPMEPPGSEPGDVARTAESCRELIGRTVSGG